VKKATLACILVVAPSILLAQGMPPAAVKLDEVKLSTVTDLVTGVATVEPWLRTVLCAETAGSVESYPIREGQEVKAGETVVCELKRATLEIDLAEAEALLYRARAEAMTAVETARAGMEEKRALCDRAERDFERAKELFKTQVVNKAELDRAEADARAASFQVERAEQDFSLAEKGADPASQARQAEVKRAEARLAHVNDLLGKCRIVSPASGRVVRRLTEVGSWVMTGGPVIEIVSLKPVLVRVNVNEREIAGIRIGNDAEVRADAFPDRTFPGKVRFIVPEADLATRALPVLIEVGNDDEALRAGMFARVSISAGEPREALTVPKDAIVESVMGTVVYTIAANPEGGPPSARPIPVRVGAAFGSRVAVSGEGLAPGLPVITTGNEKLMPGAKVIPIGAGGPPAAGGHPGGAGGPPAGSEGGGSDR
jgi:RND family efflux transporter MFP subunit